MVAPNVFQFFRSGRVLRSYRAQLRDAIRQEPAIRLLPGLLDLPLTPESLAAIIQRFQQAPRYAISGTIGSGRSLLLRQLAAEWAATERADRAIYLSLPGSDTASLSPRAILAAAVNATGLGQPLSEGKNPNDTRSWLVLLDDWEDLPPQRQQVWRTFVERLPSTWPTAHVVIALPAAQIWSGTPALALGEPDDQLLRRWIAHLLPGHDHDAIVAALSPDQPLAGLRASVRDLALLAMTYPVYGLPASHAQLYENAAALAGPVVTAAEREATGDLAKTVSADTSLFYRIGAPSWRDYNLARELVAANELRDLGEMPAPQRTDTLFAAALLASDPEPIFELLWNRGRPGQSDLHLLGTALRQRRDLSGLWALRLLETLDEGGSRPDIATLRWQLGPSLPRFLIAAAQVDEPRAVALLQGGGLQPSALNLVRLLDERAAPSALRWAAADLLSTRTLDPALLFSPPEGEPDPLASALRGYILATGSPQSRAALAQPEAASWLNSLSAELIDPARRAIAAQQLLADPAISAETRAAALTLIASFEPATRREQLGGACADPTPLVRSAALATLDGLPDNERLLVLSRVLATPELDGGALHDALDRLEPLAQGEASALLARCVLSDSLPIDGRLRALALLARRGAGPILLTRLVRVAGLHPAVRTAIVTWLGRLAVVGAAPDLRDLALDASLAPPLRYAAIGALGSIGRLAEAREIALAPLLRLLVEPRADHLLLLAAIQAVGQIGSAVAIPVLESLVYEGATDRLRTAWQALIPQLIQLAPEHWQAAQLPAAEWLALQTMMAEGETPADRPGSFYELVERQAEAVRAAAAAALSDLARADINVCNEAARILHLALRERLSATLARRLLAALARLRPDGGLGDLGRLLADGTLDTTVRWLAIEQLGEHSEAAPVLLRYLQAGSIDSFLAVKLAEQVGRIGAPEALTPLRQLADRASDMQLREAATAALGQLNDASVEDTLLHMLNDGNLPLALRVVATTALPSPLEASTRQSLRESLRNNRPPAPLAAAMLRALGRSLDREAMPMLLHYAQSEQPGEALAAIAALGQLKDESISPILVRIHQNPNLAPEVRLAAAGALLHLIGNEAMPLLQQAVGANNLSLQIQAFDLLSEARPAAAQLRSPLVDRSAPLVLRLRAVAVALTQGSAQHHLEDILASGQEPLQLRVLIASAFARNNAVASVDLLSIIALSLATPPLLRLRAINALAAIATTAEGRTAQAALGRIAQDMNPPGERWIWATQALLTS